MNSAGGPAKTFRKIRLPAARFTTSPSNTSGAATGGKLLKVRQGGMEQDHALKDGSTLKVSTAEESSSVMLRDTAGKLEYAD